jgi:O-acetyl-ADP-ribose deacetylase (regulator of RNase III)
MITYKTGNIFHSEMKTLVNPVNCVGIMGAGLALQFKKTYPKMYKGYKMVCQQGKLQPGHLLYSSVKEHGKTVLSFATKGHFKNPSELEYIERGLIQFRTNYKDLGIDSVAFPMLGCGLGGLKWSDVKPLMEEYLGDLDIPIEIYGE